MNLEQWRHYARARFFLLTKRPDWALAEYRAALALNPRWVKGWTSIGYLHAKQGQFEEAEHHFAEALKLSPEEIDIHYNLGYVRSELKQYAKAIESFSEAVRLRPVLDTGWYGMGMAYAALGEHKAAVEALEKASQLQPMGSPIWYQLGMACHHAHDPERVHTVIRHVNRFDPRTARRLILETESTDLAYLVKDLIV